VKDAEPSDKSKDEAEVVLGHGCLTVRWDDVGTERLLDWLDQNPDDHHHLFSDSTTAVKQEGWCWVVAKGAKTKFYVAMAKAVFNSPEEEAHLHDWHNNKPQKFATSVLNFLSW